jgi:hypothetical protein
MHKLVAVSLLLVAGSLQAAPVTIDFEERSVGDSGSDIFDPIQFMGFDIWGGSSAGPAEILIGDNGTQVFGGSIVGPGQDGFGFNVTLVLERSDGGAFALYSLDSFLEADVNGSTSISGSLAGGGFASLGVPVGTGDWLNLRKLTFVAGGNPFGVGSATAEIDNIVVSAVPIPAAMWLFGSALAGLGWLKRKQSRLFI